MDRSASFNPDLHFNRSTLFQYEEMFGSALEGYSRAVALNPGWDDPIMKEKQLLDYLRNVTELLQNKVLFNIKYGGSTTVALLLNATPVGGSKSQLRTHSLCLNRGRRSRGGCKKCSLTSAYQSWVRAPRLSFVPLRAKSAAWNLEHCPPSNTATTVAWPPWEKWCSAWPLKAAFHCE